MRRSRAGQSRKREDGVLALATLGQMFSYLTSLILDNLKRDSSDHAHLVDRPLKARELKFYRRAQIRI